MIHEGGYHKYTRSFSIHQRDTMVRQGDIMIHVGEQIYESLKLTYVENLSVLNILQCTHDILLHES